MHPTVFVVDRHHRLGGGETGSGTLGFVSVLDEGALHARNGAIAGRG